MTTDEELELSLLKRVFDWHDAPANTPRTLDLPWQEAPGFFGLPADTPQTLNASWERIYAALDAMVADGRVVADLYVNRVRNLKPGYRGTIELQADLAARLAAERDRLEDDRARLDTDRARLDADSDTLASAMQDYEKQSQILASKTEQVTAAQVELSERQALFDRDRAVNRRDIESDRAAVEADRKAAGQWRMAGVGAVTLAILAGVWLAATQGLFG